ncbi:MAG TPA: hypothetical protein DCE43_04285 [Planctomycetaceae bacterium]|nr:hypothetical protein [Planctomycetaceae bacterium]
MVASTNCPSCGAAVEFSIGTSLVAVCGSCQSLVGRGDGALERYGKVSDIAPTRTPLKVGIRGRHKGASFEITGRTQLQHSAGGTWNEWYLAFQGGKRWGWLSEAQGRLNLTFRQPPASEASEIPASPEQCELGQVITIPRAGGMTAVEIDEASVSAAEGELPFVPQVGRSVAYIDLQGKGQKFATIDYSETPPAVYGGREVTLDQLGLADNPVVVEAAAQVGAESVNCPSCAGPLTIQDPGASQRIACQYCGALHAVNDGKLKFLEELGKPEHKPIIPLGSEGELQGIKFTVIGYLRRSMKYAGGVYPWSEYLLWAKGRPYYWLVESTGHWSLGTAVSGGQVTGGAGADVEIHCDGVKYRMFDKYKATVDVVVGEFYWQVEKGETVDAADYVCPPLMVSREISKKVRGKSLSTVSGKSREISFTKLEYIKASEVGAGFDLNEAKAGYPDSSVFTDKFNFDQPAPNQPFTMSQIYAPWAVMMLVAIFLALIAGAMGDAHAVGRLMWAWFALSVPGAFTLMLHFAYEKSRWSESDYCPAWLQRNE